MARSRSSNRWIQEHEKDEFVKRARQLGYRSRASFKLLEILEKDHLIKSHMVVVDLGAAPGGWSQIVADRVAGNGRVVALDILPMEPVDGVEFIQGDFREDAVMQQLLDTLGDSRVDLVLSDMAPNISGTVSVDQPKAMALSELALDLAHQVLVDGGDIFIKVFQGEGFDNLYKTLKSKFKQVVTRKPRASRARSREVYLLARGYNL